MTQKYSSIFLAGAFVLFAMNPMIAKLRRALRETEDDDTGGGTQSKLHLEQHPHRNLGLQILEQISPTGSIHPESTVDHSHLALIDVREPEHMVLKGKTAAVTSALQQRSYEMTKSSAFKSMTDNFQEYFHQYETQKSTASAPRNSFHDEVNRVAKGIGLDPPVFVAIVLTLVSCTVTSLGLTLQKLSHVADKVNQDVMESSAFDLNCMYFLRLRWAFGLVVYIVGHVIGLVALGMGPQSILSGLNCWTMVMTFVYGVLLLGEEVRVHRVLGSLICFVGSLMLVYASPANAKAPTALEWFWRFGSVDFTLALTSICLVSCIVARWISVALRWALLAAALSWVSVLGAKGVAGIALVVDITTWQSWVLLAMSVALALTNVHFLNLALQRGEFTLILPFYETIALSGQAIVGGVFFREFSSFHNILQIASFSLGLLLISGGLIMMAGREKDQETGFQSDRSSS